jgi:hypothetical protein
MVWLIGVFRGIRRPIEAFAIGTIACFVASYGPIHGQRRPDSVSCRVCCAVDAGNVASARHGNGNVSLNIHPSNLSLCNDVFTSAPPLNAVPVFEIMRDV